jgi:hypothetical protein
VSQVCWAIRYGIDIFTCCDNGDVNSCAFAKHPSIYKIFAFIVGQSLSGFIFEITWVNFVMINIHMLTNHVVGFMFVCFEDPST